MARANFFDKAALAASQVLGGVGYDAFAAKLDAHTIGLAFDDTAAETPEGRIALDLTVNLLARLYPTLALIPSGDRATALLSTLSATARAINPAIDLGASCDDVAAIVAVGSTPVSSQAPIVYIGSSGWIAKLSSVGPVGSGGTNNPFGAAAATCFGAANLFRLFFGAHLPGGDTAGDLTLSLIDLVPDATAPADPALGTVDLGDTVLVGLGAIGNAAIWAFGRTTGLRGRLHLVDHEAVDLSNLQRYILATQDDVGAAKVGVATFALADTAIDVRQHPLRWGEYLRARGDWHLERVAVALDSAQDRRAVGAALPRWVVNAWTQPGDLGVSRHPFLGAGACLTCLYFPDVAARSEEQLIAEALGLPAAAKEVGQLLVTGAPVDGELLRRAADALGIPVEPLLAFEGRPLRAFYSDAICSGLIFRLGAGASERQAAVPLAFQSALAGIMLAAEVVIHAGDLRASSPVVTRLDVFRSLGGGLSVHVGKPTPKRCICQDPDYVARYRAKYGVPGA